MKPDKKLNRKRAEEAVRDMDASSLADFVAQLLDSIDELSDAGTKGVKGAADTIKAYQKGHEDGFREGIESGGRDQ